MKRLALAVLIVLFLLSTSLAGIGSPIVSNDRPLTLASNPGLQSEGALFDSFSQSVVIRASPLKHVIADFNNDSRKDLAIIYDGSNVLDIFLANQTYAFSSTPSQTLSFNWQPTGLAAGDMDKDGKTDLVVCLDYDSGENIIICYQKSGFSSTAPAAKYFYNSLKQREVIVHDLNGDGWLDVIGLYSMDDPGFQAGFAIYRSTTPNNYSQTIKLLPTEMYSPNIMTMGNFNGDARQDLVIGDSAAKKVIGYRNDADTGATWTQIGPISDVVATALLVEQLTGDGREELVMALASNPPTTVNPLIRVLRYSTSTHLFTEFVDDIPNQPSVTGLVGVLNNGDGILDLARTNSLNHNLTVFNTPTGVPTWRYSSSSSSPTPGNSTSLLREDMNNDGKEDLIVICDSSPVKGTFCIYYQSGSVISNANDNLFLYPLDIALTAVGDFNGDGLDEMVMYDKTSDMAYVHRTSATPLTTKNAPGEVTAMEAADLNADGKDELILANDTSIVVWWGGTTYFSSSALVLTPTLTPLSLGFGDLNQDGWKELVVGCSGGMEVYWNSGTGAFFSSGGRLILPIASCQAEEVQIGLFGGDGDARADIAIVNRSSSRIEIFHQQTLAPYFTASSKTSLAIVTQIGDMVSGDFDGDDRTDLATHSTSTLFLFLQYTGGFSEAPEFPVKLVPGIGVDGLTKGNLDDVGVEELALLSGNSTLIAYHYNASIGFSLITSQTVGASPSTIMCADMDGDKKDDLISYSISSQAASFFYQNNVAPMAQGQVEGSNFLELDQVWFNANGSTDTISDRDLLSYEWNFDDGTIGSGFRVSHAFSQNRTYMVTLNVSDPWGGWDTMIIPVMIGDRSPTADFSSSINPLEGAPVMFNDLSTTPSDPIVRWEWDFGDGTWSNRTTGGSVSHTYSRNDTYSVTLTVHDSDGSTSSRTKSVVVGDSSPIAAFSVSISSPLEGQSVSFVDRSTFTTDEIVRWSWNLGDGTWSNLTSNASVAHTYDRNDTYTVVLTVQDIDGSVSSTSMQLVVRNSVPTANFIVSMSSGSSLKEGDHFSLVDESTYDMNQIVSWSWNLGDGTWVNNTSGQTVNHVYQNNSIPGGYSVTLTVRDIDGDTSSFTRSIIVLDTSPTITLLRTSDGRYSYNEWEEVNLIVIASPGYEAIKKYQWDYQTTNTFEADDETELNSTYYQFNSSGTYKVTVRVWDGDSYAEASINLAIVNLLPVPDFTIQTTGNPREVRFSAEITTDTENDEKWLRYQWFFGDGEKLNWSSSNVVVHQYNEDGVYSVRLEVRDETNITVQKVRNVTIDLLPPAISVPTTLTAEVGKLVLVKANVTDQVGISSVILEYTIDNVTKTLVMTSEGGGTYFAQIPAQNRTMEIICRIIAEDGAGHVAETDQFKISVVYEDPDLFFITSAGLLIALLVLLVYLFLSRPIVDEVFVMYHDGTLLAHQTRRLKPGMDDQILGGMLIALQNFVRDSFKDESSTVLRRLDFGERKILVERKDDFFLAVLLSGKRAGKAPQRMQKVLDDIDERYADVLREWDGDLEKVRGIRDDTKPMFQRANPLDRLKRRDEGGDSY